MRANSDYVGEVGEEVTFNLMKGTNQNQNLDMCSIAKLKN